MPNYGMFWMIKMPAIQNAATDLV